MIIRAIDSQNNPQFGQGKENFLSGQKAIAENIQTRLYSFLRDCFFDLQAGIDWIRFMSVPTQSQEITLSCRAIVLQSYGVVSINSIEAIVKNRSILINMNINTIFTQGYQYNLQYVPVF